MSVLRALKNQSSTSKLLFRRCGGGGSSALAAASVIRSSHLGFGFGGGGGIVSTSTNEFSSGTAAPQRPSNIGFVGLGNMGLPMVQNLLQKKNDGGGGIDGEEFAVGSVVTFDTSNEAMSKAEAMGATPATSISNLASQHGHELDYIVTMLPDCKTVQSVVTELLDSLPAPAETASSSLSSKKKGLVFVDCSTINPVTSKSINDQILQSGNGEQYSMLDAPVSGGVNGAQQGTLTFMVGGDTETLQQTRPLLHRMGKTVKHCGTDVGMGLVAKLCNNIALASQMAGICEAMNLGTALGIDPVVLAEVMNSSTAKCWSCEVNNPHPDVANVLTPGSPATKGYDGGFGSSLMLKDVTLALHAGESAGVTLPVGGLTQSLYKKIESKGMGRKDFGVLMEFLKGE